MRARRFTLVGPGRAGLSLASALVENGWELAAGYGRTDDKSAAADQVELCVIATPDASIAEVAREIRPGRAVVMHLSGATPLTSIAHHRSAGLHPLVSLADPATGAELLRSAWFGVAGDPIAERIAESLSGKWFRIADEDRVLYHAAAAVAANHVVALLGQAERIAGEVGVPFDALVNLARGSLENVARLGPASALTGPVSRGDEATVERHRAELAERLPDELPAYDALVAEARRLAADRAD